VLDDKEWYESEGVWGGVCVIAVCLIGIAMVIAGYTPENIVTALTQISILLAALIGGGMGLHGRVKATKRIRR